MSYSQRSYKPADRAAVRAICAATAWLGAPGGDRIPDDWLWAEFWTRYFTDREPQHTVVVERDADGAVVGYLAGTTNGRQAERFAPFLVPGLVWRVVRRRLLRAPAARRSIRAILVSLARGELAVPEPVRTAFPATFHFNLLAEARGHGVGTRLFMQFRERMETRRVPGIHVQTLSANAPVARFLGRHGFRLVARWPVHAFAAVDDRSIELHTWVLTL